jgi:hypothetical protein
MFAKILFAINSMFRPPANVMSKIRSTLAFDSGNYMQTTTGDIYQTFKSASEAGIAGAKAALENSEKPILRMDELCDSETNAAYAIGWNSICFTAENSRRFVRDVIIWFEDCTKHQDRVFNETGIASRGMPESYLDKFLQTVSVSVIEKQYVEPGLLSGVRLSYQEKSVSIDFESDVRHLAQELGTNPWIRNAEEPQYLEFWNSKKPLF